jgi:hypothetical protein
MIRDLFLQAAPALLSMLTLGLIALAAWVTALASQHIRDKRYGAAVTLLAYGAAGVAADFAQHIVADLKDPTKPGKWTSVVGASLRIQGIGLLRQLYPFAVSVIERVLRDPAKVDTLLGTLLERAVVDLKSKAPAQLPAVETLPSLAADPVVLGRETVAPPEPIAPASIQRAPTLSMGAPAFDPTQTQDVTEASRAVQRAVAEHPANDSERGSISLRSLLCLFAVAALLGGALSACPSWNRPVCPTPGRWSCVEDWPRYCSPTRELTPIGDEPCGLQGRVCALRADGVARCAPRADAGLDTDGGQ